MKKACLLLFAAIVAISSYGNGKEPKRDPVSGKITMTTSGGSRMELVRLNQGFGSYVVGINGTATIDWGDGSAIDTVAFSEDGLELSHEYSDTTARTVTITSTDLTSFAKYGLRPVTSLDVSEAPGLVCMALGGHTVADTARKRVEIFIISHQLAELDVSKNTALKVLYICESQLTGLDVTKNTALTFLCIKNSKLAELDVRKNIALTDLNVSNNQLAVLDVSKNTALTVLSITDNQLTELDVTQNIALRSLFIMDNQLDAAALNALFGTLHKNHVTGGVYEFPESLAGYTKIIEVYGNPGSENCDPRIANENGWGAQVVGP